MTNSPASSIPERQPLEILKGLEIWKAQRSILSGFIRDHFAGHNGKLKFLEAGCGSKWNLDLDGLDFVLTGIDISREVLDARLNQQRDLDEAILGDLESAELEESQYDMIHCSYVLEHVRRADDVIDKFFRWLKPGGLLVILIPDRNTFRCFVARLSPHWFHVLFYRYVLKRRDAGKPGNAPFRAYYHKIVSRSGIHRYCRTSGHMIRVEFGKADSLADRMSPVPSFLMKLMGKIVYLFSFGRIKDRHSDLVYVIEKKRD